MKFSLPKKYWVAAFVFIFITIWFGAFSFALLLFILLALALFFSRIKPPVYQEELAYKDGIFYSPVNGTVHSVSKNELVIIIPWWRSTGIYLPIKSEVETVKLFEGENHFRYLPIRDDDNYSSVKATFFTDKDKYSLSFIKCYLGFWPRFRVMSGDRGMALVNIGNFILGGTAIIILPEDFVINIDKNTNVYVGETILASRS
jgi:hypothetical protein